MVTLFPLIAQVGQVDTVQARLQVDEVDNKLLVRGFCHNGTGQEKSLMYRSTFTRTNAGGNKSTSNQGGGFNVPANGSVELFTTTVNLGQEPQVDIKLSLFKGERIIAVDSFPKPEQSEVTSPPGSKDVDKGNGDLRRSPNNPDPQSIQGPESLGGFVFDQTKTPWGQQFFQLFMQGWQILDLAGNYTIEIEELPARGRITIAKIRLNNEEIFSQNLQANYNYLEQIANYALRVVQFRIQQINQTGRDLSEGDLAGDGIY